MFVIQNNMFAKYVGQTYVGQIIQTTNNLNNNKNTTNRIKHQISNNIYIKNTFYYNYIFSITFNHTTK